jgi:nitroreductase
VTARRASGAAPARAEREESVDLFDAIERRHSYRDAFTDSPVPREDLVKIVEAGLKAPSGCNAQTTTFVIVTEPELLAAIRKDHSMRAVQDAKAVIACVVAKSPKPVYRDMTFEVEDCSAAVENMLLATTALGYATVWIDGVLRDDGRAERLGVLLGVPEDRVVRVILPVGVPAEEGARREKKPFAERAWFNRHG